MAVVFVFTDEEEARAKKLNVNYMRLHGETDEALNKMLDDVSIKIFMPFLSDSKEREELFTNFHNQIVMRNIWKG